MGFKDANWAYTLDLPNTQKQVLVAICHRTDDKTHSTLVSHTTVAEMLGVHRSTVTTAVGVLARLGIITRERRVEGSFRTSDRTIVNRSYVAETNVGESNVGESNVGDSENQRRRDRQQRELRSLGQPEGQPDLLSESFDRAYAAWPKKEKRKQSLAAFRKAAKTRPLDELTADVIRFGNAYAASREKQFVPALCVWLNGEQWTDELPQPKMPTQAEWDNFLGESSRQSKLSQNWREYERLLANRAPRTQPGALRTDADRVGAILSLPDSAEPFAAIDGCEHRWLPDGTCNFCTARKEAS